MEPTEIRLQPIRYGAVHLDDLEALPGPGTLTWHPVRAHFELRAFGCNAYTAQEAGADVVEPHTENDVYAHQELYFVARGHARFTLDGEEIDAPAGTYVFVGDPKVHRHAVAVDAETTVLSFGGPPTFTPSAWEWSFRATAQRQRGDREGARATLREGFAAYAGSAGFPESPSLWYELACWEATGDDEGAARAALDRAIELEPGLRDAAADDDEVRHLL